MVLKVIPQRRERIFGKKSSLDGNDEEFMLMATKLGLRLSLQK